MRCLTMYRLLDITLLLHFLDEAPVPLVVIAVEETAELAYTRPTKIWVNVTKLAKTLSAARHEL